MDVKSNHALAKAMICFLILVIRSDLSSASKTVIPATNITEGESVTFYCRAKNENPRPYMLALSLGEKDVIREDGPILQHTINAVKGSDSGIYKCVSFTKFNDGSQKSSSVEHKLIVYCLQESSDVSVTAAVVIPLVAILAIIVGVKLYCKHMKKTQTHSTNMVYVKNSDESSSPPDEGALGDHDKMLPSVIMNIYEHHNNDKSNSRIPKACTKNRLINLTIQWYAIMLSCLNASKKKTPCFTELTAKLEKLKCDGKTYIDLGAIEPIDTSALPSLEEESS
ncbi:uncharacterized protein [Ptychodera flava]|uniref:uncharacterized protein n=1 Tax=Ptychodera flava TaxID=63121 RepID=UPI003969DC7A